MGNQLANKNYIKQGFEICGINVTDAELEQIMLEGLTESDIDERVDSFLGDEEIDIDFEMRHSNPELTEEAITQLQQNSHSFEGNDSDDKADTGSASRFARNRESIAITASEVLTEVFLQKKEDEEFLQRGGGIEQMLEDWGLNGFISVDDFTKVMANQAVLSHKLADYIKEELPRVSGKDGKRAIRGDYFIWKCNQARKFGLPVIGRDFNEIPRFIGDGAMATLCEQVKFLRWKRSLSIEKLSSIVGINYDLMQKYELSSHKSIYPQDVIERIADISGNDKDRNYYFKLRFDAIIERDNLPQFSEINDPGEFLRQFLNMKVVTRDSVIADINKINNIRKYSHLSLVQVTSNNNVINFFPVELELFSDYLVKEAMDK